MKKRILAIKFSAIAYKLKARILEKIPTFIYLKIFRIFSPRWIGETIVTTVKLFSFLRSVYLDQLTHLNKTDTKMPKLYIRIFLNID